MAFPVINDRRVCDYWWLSINAASFLTFTLPRKMTSTLPRGGGREWLGTMRAETVVRNVCRKPGWIVTAAHYWSGEISIFRLVIWRLFRTNFKQYFKGYFDVSPNHFKKEPTMPGIKETTIHQCLHILFFRRAWHAGHHYVVNSGNALRFNQQEHDRTFLTAAAQYLLTLMCHSKDAEYFGFHAKQCVLTRLEPSKGRSKNKQEQFSFFLVSL